MKAPNTIFLLIVNLLMTFSLSYGQQKGLFINNSLEGSMRQEVSAGNRETAISIGVQLGVGYGITENVSTFINTGVGQLIIGGVRARMYKIGLGASYAIPLYKRQLFLLNRLEASRMRETANISTWLSENRTEYGYKLGMLFFLKEKLALSFHCLDFVSYSRESNVLGRRSRLTFLSLNNSPAELAMRIYF